MPRRRRRQTFLRSEAEQERSLEENGPRTIRWESVLKAAVFGTVFVLTCTPMRDTDIWWHLRTGGLIWERKTVPWSDWYTFTDFDAAWIDLHWGFQLLAMLLYRLGGVPLLVLATAAGTTLAVAIGWSASGERLPAWVKAACWFLPIVCITGRALIRPELLSLVFLATTLWLVCRWSEKPGWLWCLPALLVVWVNCHGLFVLGLVVWGSYLADRGVRRVARGRWGMPVPDDTPTGRHLFRATLLMVLACFVNPYVEEGALFPLELYRKFSVDQDFYAVRVAEFQRPVEFVRRYGVRNLYVVAEAVLWLLTAASFVRLWRRGRIEPFPLLLFLAFSHLAWEASRNTNLFALVSGVLLTANLAAAAPDVRRGPNSRAGARETSRAVPTAATGPRFAGWRTDRRRMQAAVLLAASCAGAHLLGWWGVWLGEPRSFGFGEVEAWYAHAACRFAGRPGMPEKAIVANFGQAAVYIYHNAPQRRVLMDGRLEVCSRPTFELYEQIMRRMSLGDTGWEHIPGMRDRDGRLPAVVLDSRSARPQINGMLAAPGWRIVFADAAGCVFVDDTLAEELGLAAADPSPLRYPPGMLPRK